MGATVADLVARWWMVLWLAVVWVALWGELSVGNVVAGLAVGTGLLAAFPQVAPWRIGALRPWKALRFGGYFLYKLVEANLTVAWLVVRPRAEVEEGIVAVPVSGASDAILTVIANAITLTPGTLTLEVRREPPTLYVHVLQLRSPADTRRDVRTLERYVLEAFASGDALVSMQQRHAEAETEDRS